jgi:hypothetical protein
LTHALWDELNGEIQRFLSCISLADLVARKDIQAISERQALRALVFMDSDSARDGGQDQTQEDQAELDSTMRGTVSQQKNSQDNLQASAC